MDLGSTQLKRLLRGVPGFEILAACDFWYDAGFPRRFDDSREDIVLILRRREA